MVIIKLTITTSSGNVFVRERMKISITQQVVDFNINTTHSVKQVIVLSTTTCLKRDINARDIAE